jgi:hypothetical protein
LQENLFRRIWLSAEINMRKTNSSFKETLKFFCLTWTPRV